MTDEELAAIRARAKAATPGPWFYNRQHDSIETKAHAEDVVVGDGWGDGVRNEADADFIIHAREDVPALLAEVERLRDLVQREHDARLEIHREAEMLLRERDAAEARNAALREIARAMVALEEKVVSGDDTFFVGYSSDEIDPLREQARALLA